MHNAVNDPLIAEPERFLVQIRGRGYFLSTHRICSSCKWCYESGEGDIFPLSPAFFWILRIYRLLFLVNFNKWKRNYRSDENSCSGWILTKLRAREYKKLRIILLWFSLIVIFLFIIRNNLPSIILSLLRWFFST